MKKYICLLFLLLSTNLIYTQNDDSEYGEVPDETESFKGLVDEKKKLDLSRIRIGGDFGFSFGGNNIFIAEVSPIVGYQIIKNRLEVGPGLIYQHLSQAGTYAENNIGGQAYIRGYIWGGLFAQVDGFLVNFNAQNLVNNRKASFTYGNGFVGAGYAFNHEEAPFYFTISIKTNIVTDQYYRERRVIPKVGFQFRL